MRISLRPTRADDLPACIPDPLPYRIRGITALAGDRVIGIGGLGFRPDGTVIAFVAMLPEAKQYPTAIHRAGLMAMAMIERSHVPLVIAEAQEDNAAAAPWLLRLGFVRETIGGVEAFVWRRDATHDR